MKTLSESQMRLRNGYRLYMLPLPDHLKFDFELEQERREALRAKEIANQPRRSPLLDAKPQWVLKPIEGERYVLKPCAPGHLNRGQEPDTGAEHY
jgi:hypothetical protein